MDLLIFKDESNKKCAGSDFRNCVSIKRLLASLNYYTVLDIVKNEQHRNIFSNFFDTIYNVELLNDYNHLINNHGQQLEQMNASLVKCDIKTCNFTTRHQDREDKHRFDRNNHNKNVLDPKLDFFKQTMDSLHFYLFHCFDAGLRTKKMDEFVDDEMKDDDDNDDQYFDAAFDRINKMILEKRNITKTFRRFQTNNTKFSIITGDNQQKLDNIDGSTTCLDEIWKYLLSIDVKNIYVDKLKYFVRDQEFESDSIEYDVVSYGKRIKKEHKDDEKIDIGENLIVRVFGGKSDYKKNDDDNKNENGGNIEKYVGSNHCIESIQEFLEISKSMSFIFMFISDF